MVRTLSLVAVAAAFLVVACGATTPSGSPAATAASSGVPGTTPPTSTPAETAAAGPTEFGRVVAVEAATGKVTYSRAQLFEDQAAVVAAREDGKIGPSDDLPNPIYIRELDQEQVRVLSPSALVKVLRPDARGDPVLTAIPPQQYLDGLAAAPGTVDWYGSPYYSFQIGADGLITAVEHEYVP